MNGKLENALDGFVTKFMFIPRLNFYVLIS